jgi:GNAT superfamily N-acetyltransferase
MLCFKYLGGSVEITWELKVATEADVESILAELSGHMNDQQRKAFRDKLERYARKPDRALIFAKQDHRVLGYVCVIEEGAAPSDLTDEAAQRLRSLAHGTQLFVHPDFRKQGIGSSLHLQVEKWARDRGKTGFWMVTHRKAYWYARDFGFEEICRIRAKGVEKILMVKEFV